MVTLKALRKPSKAPWDAGTAWKTTKIRLESAHESREKGESWKRRKRLLPWRARSWRSNGRERSTPAGWRTADLTGKAARSWWRCQKRAWLIRQTPLKWVILAISQFLYFQVVLARIKPLKTRRWRRNPRHQLEHLEKQSTAMRLVLVLTPGCQVTERENMAKQPLKELRIATRSLFIFIFHLKTHRWWRNLWCRRGIRGRSPQSWSRMAKNKAK